MAQTVKAHIKTKYLNDEFTLRFGTHGYKGPTALYLMNDYGDRQVVTVNLDPYNGINPAPGNIIVKHYNENEGILEALIEAGIVEPETVQTYSFGFVLNGATECKLTPRMVALLEDAKAGR